MGHADLQVLRRYLAQNTDDLQEAEVLIEQWRMAYNTIRPHSALGYQPPAPRAVIIQNPQFQPLALS